MTFLNSITFDMLPVLLQELIILIVVSVIIAFILVCLVTQSFKKVLETYNRKSKRLSLFISIILSIIFGAGFTSIYTLMVSDRIIILKLVFYNLFAILTIFSLSYVFYAIFWKWIFIGCKLLTLYLQNLVKEAQFNKMQIRLEVVKVIQQTIREAEKGGKYDGSN